MSNNINIAFDNSYFRKLEGFYHSQAPDRAPSPKLIKFNHELASELGIDTTLVSDEQLALFFSGAKNIEGSQPLAQAYAGHQFGHYNPQLGDGRALLLGEVMDSKGSRQDIQLKGSGRTPFSRSGDGKAALGPVIREYLVSEAMHHLGIPTTRALAAVTTGEQIWRQTAYQPSIGAIVTRTAASHIRIGTFQFFAENGGPEKVKQLADYVIARHYPQAKLSETPYHTLLTLICDNQAKLISNWQLVGFIHGVMNTDNITVSGETIDYGPCAFMDHFHRETVFSSIDENGRYAYCNQPYIAQWNLARLAEALLPLISDEISMEVADHEKESIEVATEILHGFMDTYDSLWLKGMGAKLGIADVTKEDKVLMDDLLHLMQSQHVDFTQFFRSLSLAVVGSDEQTRSLFNDVTLWEKWRDKWLVRVKKQLLSEVECSQSMNQHNPIYIPRNHLVEEMITAAEDGDYHPFERFLEVLTHPYQKQEGCEEYAKPAPSSFGVYKTYCGT